MSGERRPVRQGLVVERRLHVVAGDLDAVPHAAGFGERDRP
jgi:hypothetical protein